MRRSKAFLYRAVDPCGALAIREQPKANRLALGMPFIRRVCDLLENAEQTLELPSS